MDRLSGLDASFLYLETPEQLMHVCGLIVLDPSTMPDGYSFDAMQDEIDSRVHDVPDVHPQAAQGPAEARPPDLGPATSTSTSTGTCTGSRCRSPAATTSWSSWPATSPACRWTGPGRCGRCG